MNPLSIQDSLRFYIFIEQPVFKTERYNVTVRHTKAFKRNTQRILVFM